MNEKECLEAIKNGDSAYYLLYEKDPKIIIKFKKLTYDLIKLLDETKKHFPDATYYTASGGLSLLLGNSHNNDNYQPQEELEAISADSRLIIGDGDY
jgi:hypothetical protein